MKNFLNKVLELTGFKKSSKYVGKYINDANIKSGIYMSIVVIALELWMILRTLFKNVIPAVQEGSPFLQTMFNSSSYYFLMSFVAISMLIYSITYVSKKIKDKTKLFLNIGFAILPIFQFFLVFIERYREGREVNNFLIVLLYVFSLLEGLVIITDSILRYKFKKEIQALSIVVVSIFATILLAFGVKVSHSDFYSGKEIMCYLTMIIYVACLLIWKPYVSVAMLGTIFLFFFYLLDWTIPHERNEFLEGDIINYVTFFISLTMVCISIYMQRLDEAKKDETLEYIANFDTLTGIYNYQHFVSEVSELKDNKKLDNDEYIYVFFNIQNFKTFNTQKGFVEANKYLIKLAKLITEKFGFDLTARVSDDHFVTLTKVSTLQENLEPLYEEVFNLDEDIHLQLKAGGYRFNPEEWDIRHAVDKARYGASVVTENYEKHYCEYDKRMEDEYEAIQYVINNIDKAVEEGWIRPYYQPVVWSDDKTLAGCEALARWIDPNKGFLSPGQFVPILESTRLVHKLDQAIIESVCRDIRKTIDNKLTPIPCSLNFSRLDFELMDDAVGFLNEMIEKYNVPKELIHVEVTESALTDKLGNLNDAINRFRDAGYALWLDDFGSGYSSLNVLKDYKFDVLKIDMKFLSGFKDNDKSRILINTIINMSDRLGMKTLTEGVETEEESDFLRDQHCGRLQGYLYGKPLSYEDLQKAIKEGRYIISNKRE